MIIVYSSIHLFCQTEFKDGNQIVFIFVLLVPAYTVNAVGTQYCSEGRNEKRNETE